MRSALIRFKFYGKQSYARFFSQQIVAALQETGLIGRFSVVTAVRPAEGAFMGWGYKPVRVAGPRSCPAAGNSYEKR